MAQDAAPDPDADPERELADLVRFLHDEHGYDLTGCARAGVARRIRRRMAEAGITSPAEYRALLAADPAALADLVETVLVHVSEFFRDESAWAHLRAHVLPPLLARPGRLRVWSAGCANGQEPYSLAMSVAEEVGADETARAAVIYATDVDPAAVASVRAGSYESDDVAGVPADLRARYLTAHDGRWLVDPRLRDAVVPGRHDLVQDPPITRVDLLVCRNTLMYFAGPARAQILESLHYALAPDGVLFAGPADGVDARPDLFRPVGHAHGLFARTDAP